MPRLSYEVYGRADLTRSRVSPWNSLPIALGDIYMGPASRLIVPARLAVLAFLIGLAGVARAQAPKEADASKALFGRDNLIAWCIVPFDSSKRGPEERAAMLEKLGFKHFAYDWRAEHIPTFDAEIDALKKHGVALDAFWVAPGELNRESRIILDALKRHSVKAQLWALIDLGPDKVQGAEQDRRVALAVQKLRPLAEEAGKIGCTVALYNHGGWFGEPENQIAIIEKLKASGVSNVGLVYNLHHGHEHLTRFSALLQKMKPYLMALNINGMDPDGEKAGRKILPLGQGSLDLDFLRTIRDSGYRGPIGILGHTQDDAEARLRDNLDGLDWLVPQLDGKPAGPKPTPRTPVPPRPTTAKTSEESAQVATLIADAGRIGDMHRGAEIFADPRLGCLSCHKVGSQGGSVGPDLNDVGRRLTPEKIVESLLWPSREVAPQYVALVAATTDGRLIQGYKQEETPESLTLRDPSLGTLIKLSKTDIEAVRQQGTLMPDGLLATLTTEQRAHLVRFVTELGRSPLPPMPDLLMAHGHVTAAFAFDRKPLHPEDWPSWQANVNRDRIYDFYAKEAEFFRSAPVTPALLPEFPGLDGGKQGHWGNQNEDVWADGRWNTTDLGSLLSGVFRMGALTVPKGVCARLGEHGELSVCFNPETLCYEALWRGGFVKFSTVRHGFMDGLRPDGVPLPRPEGVKPDKPFVYHGFYRNGPRVVFAYRIGDVEYLDAPWLDEHGQFTRLVAPAETHPLAHLTRGGPKQWPEVIETKGALGKGAPYAVDTIELPFKNPWNALLFFGGHDFLPDGSAALCTMQGDVWKAEGLDDSLTRVRWRRIASGLHQALGLVVVDGKIHVLGRDQITRLHDRDNDGEIDFYECVNNRYLTSPAGHDFICGLQYHAGNFYTVSGRQGLLRISQDGKTVDALATGFRNPDGLGLLPDGTITVPNSEGEWVPTSMICEVRPGGHYGYPGPKDGKTPDLPLVYLPRGTDNSSGGQAYVDGDRWGPLKGQLLHFSFGAGSMFLVLREQVGGQPQGAAVPIAGEFRSGAHRGRFNPKDGQLYVSGMAGWGSYTTDDGCFQRVRYTAASAQLPMGYHVHQNGVLLEFTKPIDRSIAENVKNQFVQAWNYRYSAGYGSRELSPRHPGTPGHDPLTVRSATVLGDGRSLFLELPELQPVNQLHLHVRVDSSGPHDLYATVHKLAEPFTGFPGYRPVEKIIAAHPILSDLAVASRVASNPWRKPLPKAREIKIEAGKNLSFSVRSFTVRAGEPLKITFVNPDVVPHNWVLIKPGTLPKVGDLTNRIIAEPDAVARHYVPRTDDVLVYTDMVYPEEVSFVSFLAPTKPGRYPFLCTFPGHWMVMNGEMIVQPAKP